MSKFKIWKNSFLQTLQKAKGFFIFKNKEKRDKKIPSIKQWRQLPKILSKKERTAVLGLIGLAFLASCWLNISFYYKNTIISPTYGGQYKEGVTGQPRLINPIYLSTQDVDRDLVEIVFSGLLKYDENGVLKNDLAEAYNIKDDSKTYEVFLRKNIFWHDGSPLSIDDVIFTINIIQDPQYLSPLNIKWAGVTIEKIGESGISFKLPKQYSGFLENLTLKILPKHIFENISPQNMPWNLFSPKYLVGSGPFKYKKMSQKSDGTVKEIVFERNNQYYGKKPYLNKISFLFLDNEKELLQKAEIGDIQGFSLNNPEGIASFQSYFHAYNLAMPRYFAIFFNLRDKESILAQTSIREGLGLAINKNQILKDVFSEKGKIENSPILPLFFALNAPSSSLEYNPEKAGQLFDQAGFKINPASQKREKTEVKKITPIFTKDLKLKTEDPEVKLLQECLAKDKEIYPEGEINGYFGEKTKAAVIRFQEKYPDDILKPAGLTKGNGLVKELTRIKLNQICQEAPVETVLLKFKLTTCDKFPLNQIADVLKQNWQALGIDVEIEKLSLADLQTNVLAKSNFEILLFGEALGVIPDPFPFWHSSQINNPGLNISGYNSKEADKLLEKSRESQTIQEQKESLEKFQNVMLKDIPAVFLVRPDYVYMLSTKIKDYNIQKITEPSKRFSTIEDWYIKTRRVWR